MSTFRLLHLFVDAVWICSSSVFIVEPYLPYLTTSFQPQWTPITWPTMTMILSYWSWPGMNKACACSNSSCTPPLPEQQPSVPSTWSRVLAFIADLLVDYLRFGRVCKVYLRGMQSTFGMTPFRTGTIPDGDSVYHLASSVNFATILFNTIPKYPDKDVRQPKSSAHGRRLRLPHVSSFYTKTGLSMTLMILLGWAARFYEITFESSQQITWRSTDISTSSERVRSSYNLSLTRSLGMDSLPV